jgi:hypothetical protein
MTLNTRMSKAAIDSKFSRFRLRFGRTTGGCVVLVPIEKGIAVASWSDLKPYAVTVVYEASIWSLLGTLVGHAQMETENHAWIVKYERPSGSLGSRARETGELCQQAATLWATLNDLDLQETDFFQRQPLNLRMNRTVHKIRESTRPEPDFGFQMPDLSRSL